MGTLRFPGVLTGLPASQHGEPIGAVVHGLHWSGGLPERLPLIFISRRGAGGVGGSGSRAGDPARTLVFARSG